MYGYVHGLCVRPRSICNVGFRYFRGPRNSKLYDSLVSERFSERCVRCYSYYQPPSECNTCHERYGRKVGRELLKTTNKYKCTFPEVDNPTRIRPPRLRRFVKVVCLVCHRVQCVYRSRNVLHAFCNSRVPNPNSIIIMCKQFTKYVLTRSKRKT